VIRCSAVTYTKTSVNDEPTDMEEEDESDYIAYRSSDKKKPLVPKSLICQISEVISYKRKRQCTR